MYTAWVTTNTVSVSQKMTMNSSSLLCPPTDTHSGSHHMCDVRFSAWSEPGKQNVPANATAATRAEDGHLDGFATRAVRAGPRAATRPSRRGNVAVRLFMGA